MNKIRSIALIFACLFFAAFLTACDKPVESVAFESASVVVQVGTTMQLAAQVTPSDLTNVTVTYTSSNTLVASIIEGNTLLAKAVGSARIFGAVGKVSGFFDLVIVEAQTVLETPTGLRFDELNGKIVWNGVQDAVKYEVNLNGEVFETANTFFEQNILVNETNTVRVRAVGLGNAFVASPYTENINFVKLSAPQNVAFNNQTQTLSWAAVAGVSYRVSVNGTFDVLQTTGNYQVRMTSAGSYELAVVAFKDNVLSTLSQTLVVRRLAEASNIRIDANQLLWNGVANADRYTLTITSQDEADTVIDVNNNMLDFSSIDLPSGQHTVTIVAKSNNALTTSGRASAEFQFDSLPKVSALTQFKNELSWSEVVSEIGTGNVWYAVSVWKGGVLMPAMGTTSTLSTTYTIPNGLSAGNFTVRVYAYKNGVVSTEFAALQYEIAQLSAPVIESYDHATRKLVVLSQGGEELVVRVNGAIANGSLETTLNGFEFVFDSAAVFQTVRIHEISVQLFDNTSASLSPSNPSASFHVERLAAPVIEMQDGVLTFNRVARAVSFALSLSSDGGSSWVSVQNNTNVTYQLLTQAAGTYQAKVVALGNGSTVLSSVESVVYEGIVKLGTPTVQFDKSTQKLLFGNLATARALELTITKPDLSVQVSNIGAVSEWVFPFTVGGDYTIVARVLSQENNEVRSNNSSALQIKVLAGVGALAYANDFGTSYLSFEAAEFATSYQLTINGTPIASTFIGEENGRYIFDIGDTNALFAAAGAYSIGVRALSNNSQTLSSTLSLTSVLRLAAPTNLAGPSTSNVFNWDSVAGAIGYDVLFDALDVVHATAPLITVQDIALGEHTIVVYAVGNDITTLSSLNGSQLDFEQRDTLATATNLSYTNVGGLNQLSFVADERMAEVQVFVNSVAFSGVLTQDGGVHRFVFDEDSSIVFPNTNTYNVQVVTLSSNQYISNSEMASLAVVRLGVIGDFEFVNSSQSNRGTINWMAVAGNNGYEIMLNGSLAATAAKDSISFSLTGLAFGDNVVSVRVLGNETSHLSALVATQKTVVHTYQLVAPQAVFDKQSMKLTVTPVDGANTYTVKINSGEELLCVANGGVFEYAFTTEFDIAGTYQLFIKASNPGNANVSESTSTLVTINRLATVTGIVKNASVISWTAIVGQSVTYAVMFNNDEPIIVTNPQISIEAFEKGSYTVSIRAISANNLTLNSLNYSEALAFEVNDKIAAPTNLVFAKQTQLNPDYTISFEHVTNALRYTILINGVALYSFDDSGSGLQTYVFDPIAMQSLAAGRYSLTVVTIPVAGLFLEASLPSDAIVIEKLTAPTALTINAAEQIGFALLSGELSSGFEVLSISDSNGQGISYNNLSEYEGEITILARNLGASNLHLESNAATFVVHRLATPQAPTIQNNLIVWSNIGASSGTRLLITQNGAVVFDDVISTTISQMNFTFTPGLVYEVFVQAMVSTAQNSYVKSRVSPELVAQKLFAPTTIAFEALGENQQEGLTVSWSHDGIGVLSYSVLVNGTVVATTAGQETELTLPSLETNEVLQIGVRANGNNASGYLSSEVSTAMNTRRLDAPTQLSVTTEAYLSWSAVAGATGYKLEVYSVKIMGVIASSVVTVGSAQAYYNYGSLLLEGNYDGTLLIRVMALGNGSTTLSSEFGVLSAIKIGDTDIILNDTSIIVSPVTSYVVKLFVNRNNNLVELQHSNHVFTVPDSNDWNAGSYELLAYALPTTTGTNNIIRSRKVEKTAIRLETPSVAAAGFGFVRSAGNADITELKWTQSALATKYELKINSTIAQSNASRTFVMADNIPAGNLAFELVAYGATGTHIASRKVSFAAFKLEEQFSIRNVNGVFTWDFNQAASASALKIDVLNQDVSHTITITNLAQKTSQLQGHFGQLTVKMRAIGNVDTVSSGAVVLDSNYTQSAEFFKVATPQELKATQGVLNISNSEFTNDYHLKVSRVSNPSETQTFGLFTYYLTSAFDQFVLPDVEYNAEVQATRAGYLNSDISNVIMLKVFPFDRNLASFRIERINDKVSQLAWDFPRDEMLNQIEVGGFKIKVFNDDESNVLVVDVNPEQNFFVLSSPNIDLMPGSINFQLAVLGTSETDGSGCYWLSSKYFGTPLTEKISVIKLAAPIPSLNFGNIVWQNVENATTHRLVAIEGQNITPVYTGNSINSFNLASTGIFASETVNKNYAINMLALGDGYTTLTSTFSLAASLPVVLPKTPGTISVVGGGLRFASPSANDNYYENYESMAFPNYETFANFNPYYGFIEVKLTSSLGAIRTAYLWPELLAYISGSPFANKIDSPFKVAIWHDGITRLTHEYTHEFGSSGLSSISYIGIDDIFPNIAKGTYTMTYRQMGDSTALLSSKFSTQETTITILDSVKNVRIVENSGDNKPYLSWSAATSLPNAGDFTPVYQVVAYNNQKQWWDCLYETTNTSILIDNTTKFGGADGVTFLFPYHSSITVVLKGNTSGVGLNSYVTSVRSGSNTLNVSVLSETTQFGVENGVLAWNEAINPIKYLVKYEMGGIAREYFTVGAASWNMANVAPGLYNLSVQAIGTASSTNNSAIINGKPSENKRFYKLHAPSVSLSWGYFEFNQVEVASTINNAQFIASKYITQGSLNATTGFAVLESPSQVKTIKPANTAFGSTDKWKIEYVSPIDNATYFKFQAFGSVSASESGTGFVTSDTSTLPSNPSRSRLNGFNASEKIEVLEGKLVWTKKDVGALTNRYWLVFTKLSSESEVVVYELVQLPAVFSGDASKVQFELGDSIGPGSWSVVVKNTDFNASLNSLPSLPTEFVKLHNITGESIVGGFVQWDPVVWDLDDTSGTAVIVEFEDPTNITNKHIVHVNPEATVLNENTVLSSYASVLNNLQEGEWRVRIKTGKASLPTDTIKVVDSALKLIGTVTKLGMVTNVEKSGSNIVWTAPNQAQAYNYKLKIQLKNDATNEITSVEHLAEQAQYVPNAGYSVMSMQVQTVPTSGNSLASSWTEAAIFTELSAPPTAAWKAELKGFELRIPTTETVPTNYSYSIIVQFKAPGTSTWITQSAVQQPASQPMYYPMSAGTYRIAYAIVVGGVVGKYQRDAVSGELIYCTERLYNDFAAGAGIQGDPFQVTRANIANIKIRPWAYFRQIEGTDALPINVTEPIAPVALFASRLGSQIIFSAINVPFTGNYLGENRVVQLALTGNSTSLSSVGMFTLVGTGAQISGIRIRVATTLELTYRGQVFIGLVAGQVVNDQRVSGSEPVISNITVVSGNLTITASSAAGVSGTIYFGAIAGNIDGAHIINSTNNLNVSFGSGNARSYFGGIAGLASASNAFGTIINNFITKTVNIGNISASVAGGIVCNATQIKLSETANKGNITSSVSGSNFESSFFAAVSGGLVALASRAEIEYSYNRGIISINNSSDLHTTFALTSFVGGLVARAEFAISFKSSYNAGALASDNVNTNISKRAGFIVGFVSSATPVIERLFFAQLTMPQGVTAYLGIGVSKTQTEMQAPAFVGTTTSTISSTYFVAVAGNYPKLVSEP